MQIQYQSARLNWKMGGGSKFAVFVVIIFVDVVDFVVVVFIVVFIDYLVVVFLAVVVVVVAFLVWSGLIVGSVMIYIELELIQIFGIDGWKDGKQKSWQTKNS